MKLFHFHKRFQKEEKQVELVDENIPIKPRFEYFINQAIIWTVIILAVAFIILVKKFI